MRILKFPLAGTAILPFAFASLILPDHALAQAKPKPSVKPAVATATASAPQKITSVEGITEYLLGNGCHVLIFPDPSKPTMTVNVTYKVGSRHEGYGETGMAHLLEHMVFKGSAKHSNIPKELTAHGANPNGSTWYDRTNYFETFPANDENLNWALDMESDRMVNSFIKQEDLKSEFSVVRNEFEMGENYPTSILEERVEATAFLWHNYGKSTIGSKEDIEKVPIKSLQAFYKKYYQPDNAVVIVAGKIDEAKTIELVNKYFGTIPRPARTLEEPYTVEPTQDGERMVELRRVGDVQALGVAHHIPCGSHPDYVAIDVLNEALINDPNGRLYKALVKTEKATRVGGYDFALHDPGIWYLSASILKEKSLDSAKAAFFATLDGLRAKPVTADEVRKAKEKLLKDFDETYRNTEYIGYTLSESIGSGDWRLFFLYRDRLKDVTPEDVARVAGHYLKSSNRTYGVFIPTSNPDRTIIPERPDIAAVLKDYKGGAALASAEAFDATPDNIEARTTRGELVGGAKYALLPKTTRGSTVEARISLRLGDEASMKNKATVSAITAEMLRRGTAKHTLTQFNETLNKLSSTVEVFGTGQVAYLYIKSTKTSLLPVLDLVDEMLHQPAFAADEFRTVVSKRIDNNDQGRSEPTNLGSIEFSRIMDPYPVDDVRYTPTFDETKQRLTALTLDDVKEFYHDYYNGSNASVAIVGDFDAPAIKERLNKMFYNWTAVKSYTRIATGYKEISAANKEFKTPDKKNAFVLAGVRLKLRNDNADYPALTLADFMFGGGFLNSRLATRIRQKEGISYGVGSYLQASAQDENGTFGAYGILNPENKAKFESAYREELDRIVKEGFTQEEFEAGKKGWLQSQETYRADDGGVADNLNDYLGYGRTYAFDKALDEKIKALKLPEVNAAVKKWIDPAKITIVKAGDFK